MLQDLKIVAPHQDTSEKPPLRCSSSLNHPLGVVVQFLREDTRLTATTNVEILTIFFTRPFEY